MCGLVTIVTSEGKTVNTAVLQHMTSLLAHRGPDDFGYAWLDPISGAYHTWTSELPTHHELSGILFGHRRLSILDLTAGGHQPLMSDDGSAILSFNGEIYNFVELRAELELYGIIFKSRCDTEVLLRAYQQWGTQAFNKFNGMWAFTLWDGRDRKLVVARDRFGVKPLYYTVVDGTWIFASEIKALLAYPGAFRGYNEQNVMNFLAACLIDYDETTLFRNIRAVSPGTYLEVVGQEITERTFWSFHMKPSGKQHSAGELVEQFTQLLADSVRLRVRSDVPIGTMLSGGLDSTSITALIYEQHRLSDSGNAEPAFAGLHTFHHTFSACWPGWKNNEEAEVDLICGELGLVSHKLYPTGEMLVDLFPQVVYFLEEPFETPTALVQYLLMREAKHHGVKVVLNGHGSDEVLAGYPGFFVPAFLAGFLLSGQIPRYLSQERAFKINREWSRRGVLAETLGALLPATLRPRLDQLIYAEYHRRVWDIFPGAKQLLTSPYPTSASESRQDLSPLNAALWLKFTKTILPMWLRMEDRVSMAFSVESRLPFLDYRLVEFAFNLPDELKLKDGYTKYILRQAMKDRLPERIVFNRAKQRFATPYHEWFRGSWRSLIEDLLFAPCNVQPYLDLPKFREKLRAYLAGDNSVLEARILWRVLSTEMCLRTFSEIPKA
jgi:asparagine synthase (glutamine-hydrolysing)